MNANFIRIVWINESKKEVGLILHVDGKDVAAINLDRFQVASLMNALKTHFDEMDFYA